MGSFSVTMTNGRARATPQTVHARADHLVSPSPDPGWPLCPVPGSTLRLAVSAGRMAGIGTVQIPGFRQFPRTLPRGLDARQGLEREPAPPAAAIRDLISGLLISGRTSPELGGLMLGCGIT
jgi:hypothetical protein